MLPVRKSSRRHSRMTSESRDDRSEDIIIQVEPEIVKTRWTHIEDLDSFLIMLYYYHQRHGFYCILLEHALELFIYVFVVLFSIFLCHGVDYTVLFRVHNEKTSIFESIQPVGQWFISMGFFTWSCIFVAVLFFLLQIVKFVFRMFRYKDIGYFYNSILKIDDEDLDNLTWHEVQQKIIAVQREQEMCVNKKHLTELDIYNRILRHKNYLIAMINKSLIPLHLNIPLIGDTLFMTKGLLYNLNLIFFRGPWAPFDFNWHLRDSYKNLHERNVLAKMLSKQILWIGIANFFLCPVIFLWQILYFVFNYGELLKQEPNALGVRTWTPYAKLYLRHFNELDHELEARLNRAYRLADKYMKMFNSPMMTILAKPIIFISGSIFFVLVLLACYDEDLLSLEHFLLLMSITGCIVKVCRLLIPDENQVWCPENLLTSVLAHTHYQPDHWRDRAALKSTRDEFSQLFQYRAVHLLHELLSPFVTPYILCFRLRHRALDIVDFYRNFTIDVHGIGDICTFAQMNLRENGHPSWQTKTVSKEVQVSSIEEESEALTSSQYTQAEGGKAELSLLHFTCTNPDWEPAHDQQKFMAELRERAEREVTKAGFLGGNPLVSVLSSVSNLGPEYNDIVSNILNSNATNNSSEAGDLGHGGRRSAVQSMQASARQSGASASSQRGVSKVEGPLYAGERSLLQGLQQAASTMNQSFSGSGFGSGVRDANAQSSSALEFNVADMSLSALYMHELHHRHVAKLSSPAKGLAGARALQSDCELQRLPAVKIEMAPLLLHQDEPDGSEDSRE